MREQQKEHGKPEQDSYHVGATVDQSNPGGLGQPRGPGGQQLPGHETSQTGGGQCRRDQMTLGDVTDDSDGHHQPPGKEALPGEISRIDQPNPGDEDEVADLDQMTANIANYEKLLATETDPKKIAIMRNYWQKKKPNCPTGALKMKTGHSKMRSPQWAALLAPSAGTALAFELPDCLAGSGLKHQI